MNYTAEDLHIAPGQGEESAGMLIKVRTRQLGGDFSIMEGGVDPKQLLIPHTHDHEDQCVFMLEGTLHFEVGGEDGLHFTAGPGSYVIKPRGVSHGFWNAGDTPVRYIELSGKDGFERFVDDAGENEIKAAVTAPIKHGVTFHFDQIGRLLKAHGLTSVRGSDVPEPIMKMIRALG